MLQHFLRLGLVLASVGVALACRYSVRDTGFIDLGGSAYRLELQAPPDFPAATRRSLEQAAAGLLLDSNITFQSVPPARPGEPAVLRLVDAEGRILPIATLSDANFDAVGTISGVVTSPTRGQLYREALRTYAVVVLVEGTDAPANQRAQTAARAAIDATAKLLPSMPKPVEVPPQLVVLSAAAQAAESVLLWGLGLDPAPAEQPRVVLLYGRGRRLGSPLEGPLITQTVLRERLVLIGQDCECDLDRAWLRGALYPGRWDRALQETAAKMLGFDPENPMVRSEVGQIIERGSQPGQRRKTPGTAQALGYSEESVEGEMTEIVEGTGVSGEAREEVVAAPSPRTSAPAPVPDPARPVWYVFVAVLVLALGGGALLIIRSSSR